MDEETSGAPAKRSYSDDISWHDRMLASPAGRIGFAVIIAGLIGFAIFRMVGVARSNAPQYDRVRYMTPTTQGMAWGRVGQKMPEGFYPVEYCFANTCGPEGGTPVVLNIYLGDRTPTTCTECGAEVVSHNPRPEQFVGIKPADWDD
jgi:hypothetical protein